MTVALDAPALVAVPCMNPLCGRVRMVTREQARKIRYGRASGLCQPCGHANGPAIRITEAHRRYWTTRYTEAEIVEMAEALFGPRRSWPQASVAA